MGVAAKLEVVRRIGAGGMAETLECLRHSPGGLTTRVCVKRMLPNHLGDPELMRLFELEAALSLQLDHGNIARAIEALVDDRGPALVLEYVEGVDLRAHLSAHREHGARIPVDEVLLVLRDVALALHHAHTLVTPEVPNGMVHRDVSPSNVLLGIDGDVKLVDFGIAKAVGDAHRTTTGTIRGKIPYMAPEYARMGRYDVRSDLFSLGVVGYELLTSKRPYQGRNDPETLDLAASGKRTPIARLRSDAPAELAFIVEALLSPLPEMRPQSARAVLGALEGLGGRVASRTALAERVRARCEAKRRVDAEPPTEVLDLAARTLPLPTNEKPRSQAEPASPISFALRETELASERSSRAIWWMLAALGTTAIALGTWLALAPL